MLHALNNSWGLFYVLGSLAYMEVIKGQHKRAARLFGFTQHLGEKIGTSIVPCE
jgi:hypothetical protein